MASFVATLTSLFTGDSKPSESPVSDRAPAGMHMEQGSAPARQRLCPPGLHLAYMFYERSVALAMQPALSDDQITKSGALAYATNSASLFAADDDSEQSTGGGSRPPIDWHSKERRHNAKDVTVSLSSLIKQSALTSVQPLEPDFAPAQHQFTAVLNSNCAVVLELALVIDDANWSPHDAYIDIALEGIAGVHHRARHTLGDVTSVAARCAAQAHRPQYHSVDLISSAASSSSSSSTRVLTPGKQCALNEHNDIYGWCPECGQRPNKLTLHQSVLDPRDVFHYMPEVISPTGTHGHIVDAPSTHGATDRLGSRRVQISLDSTIAQDLCREGRACHDTSSFADSSDGSIYVEAAEWDTSVARVANSVLVNVPLASLDNASVRLMARTDMRNKDRSLNVTLIAQCVGFARQ